MALIELKNIGKSYCGDGEKTTALENIFLSVEEGEFVAIMGPSGSGKSTLLHVMGFLDRQTTGSYLFEGKDSNGYSDVDLARIRNKKIGFVFQSFNLLARTSVLENVKLPLLYSGVKESYWNESARKAISAVGLLHRENHEPSQLSGGEKQRAAIARALVTDPMLIFADEPTGNLDSKSGGQVMEAISKLHVEGKTIILITHETYTAEYAQRIIHLKDGQVESDQRINQRKDVFIK